MTDHTHHAHGDDLRYGNCLAINKSSEMYCPHDIVTADFVRRTVRVTSPLRMPPMYEFHTFTDCDDDAIALVIADDPTLAVDDDATLTVVFRGVPNPS